MEAGAQVGAYRVLEPLGAGGMGAVWMAEHAMLGRRAAIKLLRPEYAARPDIVTRFFNEARAATRIADPGIVQIFDFGYHGGSPYIAMELLEGEPLDARLRREHALRVEEALRIVRQVATTLGAAHAAGIVHRDLKPENIFLVRDPAVEGGERAKILDFGIAKLNDPAQARTQTAVIMGTPHYMAPEQCRGAGGVDQRADVYAIGCVLFALVTGRPPFDGASGELIAKHMFERAPRASQFVQLPGIVDDLIDRCLAKEPGDRFASGRELGVAIGQVVATPAFGQWVAAARASFANAATAVQLGHPTSAPTVHAPPVVAISTSATTLTSGAGTGASRPEAAGRGMLISILVAAIVVGSAGAIYVATTRDGAPAVASPPADSAPPIVEPIAPPDAAIVEPPPGADVTRSKIGDVFQRFNAWVVHHPDAACPSARELTAGEPLVDGWGHAMRITCTDQPADQRIGVVSPGEDGAFGSADDLASWMDAGLAAQVRGERFGAVDTGTRPRPGRRRDKSRSSTPEPAIELDEDGVPKQR